VCEVIDSGWLTTGAKTVQFEQEFARFVGVEHAVALNSCTGGLHLSLLGARIGPGHAVITTPFTFVATVNTIVHAGAQPLMCDIDPDTYNLDPAAVRAFISEKCRWNSSTRTLHYRQTHKEVKAIVVVHYGGHPCDMLEFQAIASEYNLTLIEDAAHALGATYLGKAVGTFGHMANFSFYANKNLSTGEGGMFVTNDGDLARRVRRLSLHGLSSDAWKRYTSNGSWRYDIEEPGFKYNLTDIASAIGLVQLHKQAEFIRRRSEIAGLYGALLEHLPFKLPTVKEGVAPAWHLYPVQFLSSFLSRDNLIEQLRTYNIGTSVHFIPVHLMSFYSRRWKFHRGDYPVAEGVFERILSLPFFPKMTDGDVARVAETVATILSKQRFTRMAA
jgi:dTDP-4-amino-4,6-dideoxygalactose transaminase